MLGRCQDIDHAEHECAGALLALPLAALPSVELDLGWKSDRNLIAHLDWADIAVLPYIEASQSGIAPMIFKRGRPVIATPVGGLPEQVRSRALRLPAS